MTMTLRKLMSIMRAVAVVLLGLVATLMLVMRLVLAWLPAQAELLEERFTEAAGMPVHLGAINSFWQGFSPVITVAGITLGEVDEPAIHIDSATARLDVLRSLLDWQVVVDRLYLQGRELVLLQGDDGAITLAGLPARTDSRAFQVPPWLGTPRGADISLARMRLVYPDAARIPLELNAVRFRLRHEGERYRLFGEVQVVGGEGGAARVAGSFDAQGIGTLYMNVKRLRPTDWLRQQIKLAHLAGFNADLVVWADWDGRRITAAAGNVQLRAVNAEFGGTGSTPARRLVIDYAKGRWSWQRQSPGWRLDVDHLTVARADRLATLPHVAMQQRPAPDSAPGHELFFGVDRLSLEALNLVARASGMIDAETVSELEAVGIQGQIDDLRGRVQFDGRDAKALEFAGRVTDLNINAWNALPGVRGLSAEFRGTRKAGVIALQGSDVVLDAARWFKAPFPAAQLQGQFAWQVNEDKWSVSTRDLMINTPHINSRTRMQLTGGDGNTPFIDMQIDVADLDIAGVKHYLPDRIMPPKAVSWLGRGLVSGTGVRGGVLIHGPANKFPYRNGEGRFQALVDIENAELEYDPAYPRITGLDAGLAFDAASMDIFARAGQIFAGEIAGTHVSIDELKLKPRLVIDGVAVATVSDGLRYLRESPLARVTGPYLANAVSSGDTRVELDMQMPLSPGQAGSKIDANIHLQDAGLDFRDIGLQLTAINGQLHATKTTLNDKGLRARFLNRPVRIEVQTPRKGTGTVFRAYGQMPIPTLAREYPGDWSRVVSGRANWAARLDLSPASQAGGHPPRLTIESALKGVTIKLPAPVGKAAAETRKARVVTVFEKAGQQQVTVSWGDRVSAALAIGKDGDGVFALKRGEVRLGGKPAHLPAKPGVRLVGQTGTLDLDAWLAVIGQFSGAGGAGGGQIDLRVDTLHMLGKDFTQVNARLRETGGAWSGTLDGDQLAGQLHIPVQHWPQERLRLKLDRLVWQTAPDSDAPAAPMPDPRTVPPLDIDIAHLWVDDRDFGSLQVKTQRTVRGQRLKQLVLKSPHLEVDGHGSWEIDSGQQKTVFETRVKAPEMEPVVALFGGSFGVDEAPATIDAGVAWPGGPNAFSIATLEGVLDIELGQGRFLELEPGVGRVFGLLSMGTLQRRLSLDFTDLVGKGFSFDRIRGRFTFDKGIAYTNSLELKGPVADIFISGNIGLVKHDYDQTAVVTPRLTASLPLAGALAGGPAVGAALFLADKLFGSTVNKITEIHYEIKGSWENPTITRVKTTGWPTPAEK